MNIAEQRREVRLQHITEEARRSAPSAECAGFVVATALSLEEMALREANRTAHRLVNKLRIIDRIHYSQK